MGKFRFPTQQFRAIPSPSGGDSRVGLFYVPTQSVPPDLWDWREVNPREVKRGTSVYKQIAETLKSEPGRFHERNRGITLIAKDVAFDDKRKEVILHVDDPKLHGVVDGAHTLDAIIQAQQISAEEGNGDATAHVFVKVFTGVEPDQIAEIAGGLNTSQQVDLKSLENLREHFEELKQNLADEPYADKIAYKMNEAKPVDVREVLYYMAVFDCSEYTDKKHPVALFGRKEGIVRRFADQANEKVDAGESFRILISNAKEILRLRDMIEEKALLLKSVGRYKAGSKTRIRSESNRENDLVFLDKKVNGRIPLGWLLPMLAGFRANVEWNKPKKSFSWKVPLEALVDSCIETLVLGIQEVHDSEGSRPEYVGRNGIAWRMSYNTVSQAILQWELVQARAKAR